MLECTLSFYLFILFHTFLFNLFAEVDGVEPSSQLPDVAVFKTAAIPLCDTSKCLCTGRYIDYHFLLSMEVSYIRRNPYLRKRGESNPTTSALHRPSRFQDGVPHSTGHFLYSARATGYDPMTGGLESPTLPITLRPYFTWWCWTVTIRHL